MRVWTCVDHETFWPVGGASVVVAPDQPTARELLRRELERHGLKKDEPFTLLELDIARPQAVILNDGDY
jgi:hypothetical protein